MKNWSAYRKLYLSYACILLIPLVMAFFFYSYSYRVVQRQSDASNINLIRTLKESCDRELEYYENVLLQLALDKTVQELSGVRSDFGSKDYYQLYTLYNEINALQMAINQSGNYCNDITVYFKNNGKLVSTRGCFDFEMFCDLYCFEEEKPKEWLENYFSQYHVWEVARSQGTLKDGSSPLLLTMTNMKGDFGETTAMIALWVEIDDLAGSMELESGQNGMDWLMISDKNEIISRPEDFVDMEIYYDNLEEGSDGELEFEGEKFILRTTPSEVFDWKYVLMMPERSIGSSVKRLRNFFALCLLVCVGIGFAAANQMTKRSYDPLKALLEMFRGYDKENRRVGNEYVYLREKAMALFEEPSEFQERLHQSLEVVRQYYLIDLLITPFGEQASTPEREELYRKFGQGRNLVLLLKIRKEAGEETEGPAKAELENVSQAGQKEQADTNNLQKFIVRNVFGEGLLEAFDVEMIELGDVTAALINYPRMEKKAEDRLLEILDNMQKFIYDHFQFRVAVCAGEDHEGLAGIHRAYREAREAETFLPLLEWDYIRYRDIRDTSGSSYKYSMSQEEKIITAIKKSDTQLAISYINGVLDVNFRQLKTSPAMRRCLLYDLTGTLMKAAQEAEQPLGEELELKEISITMGYQEIKDKFAAAVEKMCRFSEVDASNDSNSQLCEEVHTYIQENYGDQNLNVSQIGEFFHMTPAYLSSVYKRCTGESLLQVLIQTRIEAAERLLADGVSVVETAERVGFRDSSTFIRTFKKSTGATPGQLKNNRRYK